MLNQITNRTFVKAARRRAGERVVAFVYFAAAGIAMVAWIAVIAWVGWHLIASLFS